MSLWVFFLFLLGVSSQQLNTTIRGQGASFPVAVYEQWITLFRVVSPATPIIYESVGSTQGRAGVLDMNVIFGASDAPFSMEDYETQPGLTTFPTVAGGIVLQYNLPGLSNEQTLILNGPVVADIFLGTITMWNDPRILVLQDSQETINALNGITQPMQRVLRADGSGTTTLFTSWLAVASDVWSTSLEPYGVTDGTFGTWPSELRNGAKTGLQNIGVFAAVDATPYSITYVGYADVFAYNRPFARLLDVQGTPVLASPDSMTLAMDDPVFDDRFSASLVGQNVSGAWPIVGFTYMGILNNSQAAMNGYPSYSEEQHRLLAEFLRFGLENEDARRVTARLGFVPLGPKVLEKVIVELESVVEDEKPVFQYIERDSQRGPLFQVFLALTFFFFVVTLIFYAMVVFSQLTPHLLRILISCVLATIVCMSIGQVMLFVKPYSAGICFARIWLLYPGAVGVIAITVARMLYYQSVRKSMYSGSRKVQKVQRVVKRTMYGILKRFALFVGIEIVLLIVWSAVAPPASTEVILDPPHALISVTTCYHEYTGIFYGIQMGYIVVLSLVGIYATFSAWDIQVAGLSAPRYVLLVIYTYVIAAGVFLAVYYSLPNDDYGTAAVEYAASLLIMAISCVGLFGPPILTIGKAWTSSGSGGSGSRFGGSSMGSKASTMSVNNGKSVQGSSLVEGEGRNSVNSANSVDV